MSTENRPVSRVSPSAAGAARSLKMSLDSFERHVSLAQAHPPRPSCD